MGRLCVLHAVGGKRLAKIYAQAAGGIVKRAYDNAFEFLTDQRDIDDVAGLYALLAELQHQPDTAIVHARPNKRHLGAGRPVTRLLKPTAALVDGRGKLHNYATKGEARTRQGEDIAEGRLAHLTRLPMFEAGLTDVHLLDFDRLDMPSGIEWRDDLAYTAAYLRQQLPVEFHAAACAYYATSSAADPSKPDWGGPTIKMRLGFITDRALSAAESKRWLARVAGLDRATLNPIQLIYTAAPVYSGGLTDPLAGRRLGTLEGTPKVAVPELEAATNKAARDEFVTYGPALSAEGAGLRVSPELDAALERLADAGGAAGEVRSALRQCAFAYIRDVGRDGVDIAALAELLAKAAKPYRSPTEIDGYGLENLIAWAIERTPLGTSEPDEPHQPHYPEIGLSPEEADDRLQVEMTAAVAAAVAWRHTDGPAPVVGIKAGAGLGKTQTALERLVAIPGVDQMYIEIYVQGHRFAQEMALRIRGADADRHGADNPELRVIVMRGRGVLDADGTPMCVRNDLAEKLGGAGLDVSGHMCLRMGADGMMAEVCGDHKGCRHQDQFRNKDPAIRIFPHAAMFVPRDRRLQKPDLIVIEETFWAAALPDGPVTLALDRLTAIERWRVRPKGGGTGDFERMKARKEAKDREQDATAFAHRVRAALEEDRDPRAVVTAEEAGIVAGVEWGSRSGPGISPGMGRKAQVAAFASWQDTECAKAARFWQLLAGECEHLERPMQRIVLERNAETEGGDRRHLVHLHYRRKLTLPAAPVILLDADLDPLIAGKFFPNIRVVDIPVRQEAQIVQVIDRTCSMRFLLGGSDDDEVDQRRAAKRFGELERFAARVLADGGLFATYKAAIERIKPPPDVDAAYLGDIRGKDGYKHHNTAAIAGRLEPGTLRLEDMTRAIFGDEALPIITIAPGEHGGTRYHSELRRYRMADGTAGPAVRVSVHPDPRAQALLEQVREREIEQTVARLRLVHRGVDRPATIYLLTNIPLNLGITTLTTWSVLVRDREAEARHRWGGAWLCSASERAKAAPDLWSTPEAARAPHRGNGGPPLDEPDGRVLVEYRYPDQRGSAHQAFVPGADDLRAKLEKVVGQVTTFAVVSETMTPDATAEPAPIINRSAHFDDVMLHSPSELVRLAPDVWPTKDAAKGWLRRAKGVGPRKGGQKNLERFSRALCPPFSPATPLARVEYRHTAQAGSRHVATIRSPTETTTHQLRAKLEAVVGQVASFEVLADRGSNNSDNGGDVADLLDIIGRDNAYQERFSDVTPHSSSELARLAPDVWPTPDAAKSWLRRRNEGSPGAEDFAAKKGGRWWSKPSHGGNGRAGNGHPPQTGLPTPPTAFLVEYRLAGQRGSAHRATVRSPTEINLRARLEVVVGPVATFEVLAEPTTAETRKMDVGNGHTPPHWTDDRFWCRELNAAGTQAARQSVLRKWGEVAGGWSDENAIHLPDGLQDGLALALLKAHARALGLADPAWTPPGTVVAAE